MVKSVFPGSFDPPTYGHLNIIERATKLFDSVDVVLSINPEKEAFLKIEERYSLLKQLVAPFSQAKACLHEGLLVDYCHENGAKIIIRGVRNSLDFYTEWELSSCNKYLSPEIETLFLPSEPQYALFRSSTVRKLLALKSDISSMVPPLVKDVLERISH